MTTAPTAPHRTPRGLAAILLALAIASIWFVGRKHPYLTDFSLATYTEYFWPRRWGLVVHLLSGTIAISAGLVQLWLGLTGRSAACTWAPSPWAARARST